MSEIVTQDATALIREAILQMKPYTPILPFEVLSEQLGRPPGQIVKLDANENPYGPSPKALEALRELAITVPIYPDPEARQLRALLSDYVGIDAAHILVGAGADELIDLVMRLFLDPGDAIINCPPTFGMYAFDAALAGAKVVSVPRRADFSLDLTDIERAARDTNAKLLFITTPNNPDGGLLDSADLDRLLRLPLVVILDEAYIEFSGATAPEGTPPWLTDTFNDYDTAGSVDLILEATNLIDSEFVFEWLFNIDPAFEQTDLDDLDFTQKESSKIGEFTDPTITATVNEFLANGDGYFDIEFKFDNSDGAAKRFGVGDGVTYTIEGIPTLTASSFYFLSYEDGSQGEFRMAAHVGGIGPSGNYSGWVSVPEPGTLALLALGGLPAIRRRRP